MVSMGRVMMQQKTLDRKVEVVSGNAPHASSVSTLGIIAKALLRIKGWLST